MAIDKKHLKLSFTVQSPAIWTQLERQGLTAPSVMMQQWQDAICGLQALQRVHALQTAEATNLKNRLRGVIAAGCNFKPLPPLKPPQETPTW